MKRKTEQEFLQSEIDRENDLAPAVSLPTPTPPRRAAPPPFDLAKATKILEDGERRADERRMLANFGQAGSQLIEGVTGARAAPGFYDGLRSAADDEEARAKQRVGLMQRQREDAMKQVEAERLAALDDPTSFESEQIRKLFAATHPLGETLSKDAAFKSTPASMLPSMKDAFRNYGSLHNAMIKADEVDPQSALSKDAQAAALAILREGGREVDPTLENAIRSSHAKDIDSKWMKMLDAERQQRFRESLVDKNATIQSKRDAHRDARRAALAKTKDEKERIKADEKRSSSSVGYDAGEFVVMDGYGPPEASVRSDFTKKTAASSAVQNQLREIKRDLESLATNPSGKIASAARSRIQSRQSLIAPLINVSLGQGAMAAEEFARVKESIGDISNRDFWIDALSSALSNSNEAGLLAQRLDTAASFFDAATRQHANTLNMTYQPRRRGNAKSSAKRLRVSNGSEMLEIDATDLVDAERDGFKVIE